MRVFAETLLTMFLVLSWTKITANAKSTGQKLIIDTDASEDDATAIALALEAQKQGKSAIAIIAITCTFGSIDVQNASLNVARILKVAKRHDVPVYLGAYRSLLKNFVKTETDEFDDVFSSYKISLRPDRFQHASVVMVELTRSHPGEIIIATLGPLTNVAIAHTLDPKFARNVKMFYVLGSSVGEKEDSGLSIEFNFAQDPLANFIAFRDSTLEPIVLFPQRLAEDLAISSEWRVNKLGTRKSQLMDFLNAVERENLEDEKIWDSGAVTLMTAILRSDVIKESRLTKLTPNYKVDTGEVSVNDSGPHNTEIVLSVDLEELKLFLLEIFSGTSSAREKLSRRRVFSS